MPHSENVTECRSRNNGMLRNNLQTDLGTGLQFVTFNYLDTKLHSGN